MVAYTANSEQYSTKQQQVFYRGLFTYYVISFLKSKTEFCDRRLAQLVVAVGHNIFIVTGTPNRGQRPPQFLVNVP